MIKQGKTPIICYFVENKKPLKPSKENKEKYWISIEDRDKISESSKSKA